MLMSIRESGPFHFPVDPVYHGLHDYTKVVKHPMDLTAIKAKLDIILTSGTRRGTYSVLSEWVADVLLVFDNAILYNPPGEEITVSALALKLRFEQHCRVVLGYEQSDDDAAPGGSVSEQEMVLQKDSRFKKRSVPPSPTTHAHTHALCCSAQLVQRSVGKPLLAAHCKFCFYFSSGWLLAVQLLT